MVLCFQFTVAAQKGPGIVIAHPGEDVTLLCSFSNIPNGGDLAWTVNGSTPYTLNNLHGGVLPGHGATGDNIIVENITLNDNRNETDYRCLIINRTTNTTLNESDPTILYVAGEYQYRLHVHNHNGAISQLKHFIS